MDSVAEIRGLRIAGSSWIPPISGRWAFDTQDEAELARRMAWIPEGVDVLVTHSPPYVEGGDIEIAYEPVVVEIETLPSPEDYVATT